MLFKLVVIKLVFHSYYVDFIEKYNKQQFDRNISILQDTSQQNKEDEDEAESLLQKEKEEADAAEENEASEDKAEESIEVQEKEEEEATDEIIADSQVEYF